MRIAYCLAASILGLLILGDPAAAAEAPIGALPRAGTASALPAPEIDLARLGARGSVARAITEALDRLNADASLALRGRTEKKVFRKVAPKVVLVVTPDAFGSGTVVDDSGLILTSWHVVEGHDRLGVIYYVESGRQAGPQDVAGARVVKIDQVADLALLQAYGRLPRTATPVDFGSTRKLRVGSDVHAIGHPEGETWTYTGGFVSQIRPGYQWAIDGLRHQATVIQTQTPINPGNSGGPLLDDKARLVGVNTFIADGEGLNYAVSVDDVKSFLHRRGDRLADRAPMAGQGCEAHVMYQGRTEADDADMRTLDLDCDGTEDAAIVDYDDKSIPLQLFVDIDGNRIPGGVVLDNDRDGHWDVSYWDTDYDGTTDLVGYHPDGDFEPSEYGPYKPEG